MDINTIVEYVLAVLPSIIAVISTVGMVCKTLGEFKKLKSDVGEMTAMKELREELKIVLQENAALKKEMKCCLARIDHVHISEAQDEKV